MRKVPIHAYTYILINLALVVLGQATEMAGCDESEIRYTYILLFKEITALTVVRLSED